MEIEPLQDLHGARVQPLHVVDEQDQRPVAPGQRDEELGDLGVEPILLEGRVEGRPLLGVAQHPGQAARRAGPRWRRTPRRRGAARRGSAA